MHVKANILIHMKAATKMEDQEVCLIDRHKQDVCFK